MSWGGEALQRAVHGDGEVAAAELVGVAWLGERGPALRGVGPRGRGGAAWGGWEAGAGLRPSSAMVCAELCRRR